MSFVGEFDVLGFVNWLKAHQGEGKLAFEHLSSLMPTPFLVLANRDIDGRAKEVTYDEARYAHADLDHGIEYPDRCALIRFAVVHGTRMWTGDARKLLHGCIQAELRLRLTARPAQGQQQQQQRKRQRKTKAGGQEPTVRFVGVCWGYISRPRLNSLNKVSYRCRIS